MVAPTLCSAFKGVMPSDLFRRYDCEGGQIMLAFDMEIAAEISTRILEQTTESRSGSRGAKSAVAKRNQRREERAKHGMTGGELGELLSDTFDLDKSE